LYHLKNQLLVNRIGKRIDQTEIFWAAIVLSRLGAARWVLAVLIAYAAYTVAMRIANTAMGFGLIADIGAVVSAAFAVFFLFRADAKAWFGKDDGQVSDQL